MARGDCRGCKAACGSSVGGEKVVTGWVLKELCSGLYLDYDDVMSDNAYYLHADRSEAIRFSSREAAIDELTYVALEGIELDTIVEVSKVPIPSLRFKPVKLVKRLSTKG